MLRSVRTGEEENETAPTKGGKLTQWKIDDEVSGRRRRSLLLQGGLEIPCTFTVEGPSRFVQRVQELVTMLFFSICNIVVIIRISS